MELKMVRAEEMLTQLEPKYRKTMSGPWKHDDHPPPRQLSWPILLDSKALIVRNCGQVIVLLTELNLKYRMRKRDTICKGFLLRKVCLLRNKAIRTHCDNGASLELWWEEGFLKTLALSDGKTKGQGQEKKTLENIPVLECVDNLWQKEFEFLLWWEGFTKGSIGLYAVRKGDWEKVRLDSHQWQSENDSVGCMNS